MALKNSKNTRTKIQEIDNLLWEFFVNLSWSGLLW